MRKDAGVLDDTPQLQPFRVYVEQINQTMLEVQARDADEAREKGYAKWRRDYAHSRVCAVESAR